MHARSFAIKTNFVSDVLLIDDVLFEIFGAFNHTSVISELTTKVLKIVSILKHNAHTYETN